jgi:two-component system phosphate regulon response regulator PhoB
MARILVVEDEADLRQVIEFNLAQHGHEVETASTGAEGLRRARARKPDLVLLDIMLPDVTGLDVCRQIKADAALHGVAVVLLTARGEEIDRVVGFEIGADDYVVKPFSVRELILRIGAILRRSSSEGEATPPRVQFGVLSMDREAHRVWVDGEEVELTALEFKLLATLYDRRDRVQTRSALLDVVWGIRADVTTRTVDTHVKRLREKLGAARDYVETVRGVGYRFIGEVGEAAS